MVTVEQMYVHFKKMVENGHGNVNVYTSGSQCGSERADTPTITVNLPEMYEWGPLEEEVEKGTMICVINTDY